MRLTTKGRYAVTAMVELAMHQQGGAISLAEIAARQGISLSYLEQLFARLRGGGLVSGQRGPGGGYRLAREARRISIAHIIGAVDESLDATLCGGTEDCDHGARCLTHDLWSRVSDNLQTFLDEITLGDVIQWSSVKAAAERQGREAAARRASVHVELANRASSRTTKTEARTQ